MASSTWDPREPARDQIQVLRHQIEKIEQGYDFQTEHHGTRVLDSTQKADLGQRKFHMAERVRNLRKVCCQVKIFGIRCDADWLEGQLAWTKLKLEKYFGTTIANEEWGEKVLLRETGTGRLEYKVLS